MHGVYSYEQFKEINKHPNFGYITQIKVIKLSGDEIWIEIDNSGTHNVTNVPYVLNLVIEGRATVTNPSALKKWNGWRG